MKQVFTTFLIFSALFANIALIAQPSTTTTGDVRGFVYDKETGEPVIFTNVYMEGTSFGASTDVDGFYPSIKCRQGVMFCSVLPLGSTLLGLP